MMTASERRVSPSALLVIVLAAFLLRVAAVVWIPTRPVSDFFSFRFLTLQLLKTGGMPGWCSIYGPGYPIWLAAVARLFGPGLAAARLANCILSAVTVGFAGLLAQKAFGRQSGLVAATLLCVDPRQILQTCLLASENLSAPLTFAFLLLIALSWRNPDATRLAALAGIVLGLAALTRPATRPLFLLWPVTALFAGKPARRVVTEAGVLAAVVLVVLLPWGAWNMRHNHRWLFSTSTVGLNLFMGNHAGATGNYFDWLPVLLKDWPEVDSSDPAVVDRAAGEAAKLWIRSHPLGAIHLYVRKLETYFWKDDPSSVAEWAIFGRNYWPPDPPTSVLPGPHFLKMHPRAVLGVLRAWYFALLAAGLAALVVLAARTVHRPSSIARAAFVLIGGACASFPLLTCAFIVVDRYRWPFEDLLCVLIAGLVAARE